MSAETKVVPVSPSDHEALADFLSSFPALESSREFWKSRFELWWTKNPACAGAPAGWMLKEAGAIKGFLGDLPSLFQLGGKPTTVHAITSWMVLPELREQSLALLMEHMSAAKGSLLFDTTPTAEVAEVLGSMGFEPLPWAGERESFIVTDWKRVLEAASPELLRGVGFSHLGAAALAPLQAGRLKPLHCPGMLQAAEISEIGQEFDELWDATKGLYANTNVRTAEALRWHCLGDAHIEKRLFAARREGRLAGFMILKSRIRRGLKTLDCADFWEDPKVSGVLESLLAEVWRYAQKRGLDLLSFPHFTARLGERLARAGLFERTSGRRALFLGEPKLIAAIKPEDSYLVGLQGDYGTAVS